MGTIQSNQKSMPDYSAHWEGKYKKHYYDYFVDGTHITCIRRGIVAKKWEWTLGEYPIVSVTSNANHLMFRNSEGEVFILKYGKMPTKIKLPWIADLIHSESCLVCDFSLIFFRIVNSESNGSSIDLNSSRNSIYSSSSLINSNPPLSSYKYRVISITESNSTQPLNRMYEIAEQHRLNVATFMTDTVSEYGMLSKLVYLKDIGVKFFGKDSDIIEINSTVVQPEPESKPTDKPQPQLIQSPRERLLHRLNNELEGQTVESVNTSTLILDEPADPAIMGGRDQTIVNFDLSLYHSHHTSIPLNQSNMEVNSSYISQSPYYSHPALCDSDECGEL